MILDARTKNIAQRAAYPIIAKIEIRPSCHSEMRPLWQYVVVMDALDFGRELDREMTHIQVPATIGGQIGSSRSLRLLSKSSRPSASSNGA